MPAPAYPPPPWLLAGRVVVVVAPVDVALARALVPAPLRVVPVLSGRALAAVVLGLYGEGSTLEYAELAGIVGPVAAAGSAAGFVHAMYVDDPRSRAGGRELWRLPKELARFRWRPGAAEVTDTGGDPLVRAAWREPRVRVPVAAASPFVSVLDGVVGHGRLAGRLRVAPAAVSLEVRPGSPLAALPLGRPRWGFAGRLDVRAQVAPGEE
jgi:hypothetical protein